MDWFCGILMLLLLVLMELCFPFVAAGLLELCFPFVAVVVLSC